SVESVKGEKITLDDIPADQISFTLTKRIPLQSGPAKEIYIFVNGDKNFVLDYTISLYPDWAMLAEKINSAKIEKEYSDIFNQIISTFKFLE
ncbi:MAG: hypothetical protein AAB959_01220, partial [Patescibacteria group bacterium]